MSAQEFDFNSLFEDPSAGGFGCVFFDFVDQGDGKMGPLPGKGWASIGGEKAQRINSIDDLSSEIKWVTNLDRNTFWKSGCVRYSKLRESTYLKTDIGQIMREMGIVPKNVTTAGACEQVSEVLARTLAWGQSHYDVDQLSEQEWADEIRPRLYLADVSTDMEVDMALQRSYVDYIICSSPKLDGGRMVTLRRPRLSHARTILNAAIPYGGWEFIAPTDMPEDQDRFNWLWAMQRPVLVKVAVKGYVDRCPGYVVPLLQLGDALGEGGRKKERNWMTLQEVMYFSKYAKVEIQAAFVAEGWTSFGGNKRLLEVGELSDFSMSLGLLAEAHWMALAGRSRNPITRSKTMVSPRAAWFRTTDRFFCFSSALPLAAAGFNVISYGGGCVSVAARPENMAELAEVAAACGLNVPAVLFDGLSRAK